MAPAPCAERSTFPLSSCLAALSQPVGHAACLFLLSWVPSPVLHLCHHLRLAALAVDIWKEGFPSPLPSPLQNCSHLLDLFCLSAEMLFHRIISYAYEILLFFFFNRNWVQPVCQLGRIGIFIMLNLPIHEHGYLSLYLEDFDFFGQYCVVLAYTFCTFFVRMILHFHFWVI